MATKFQNHSDLELRNIAKQLQCPNGVNGVFIAQKMSQNNIGMILSGMLELKLKSNDTILELGHGDGTHVNKLYTMAHHIRYYGLDISPLMIHLSQKNNKHNKNASFNLYDGEQIIYKDCFFDRVLTVNTIYFFKNPEKTLNEIYRVLKPNGTFVVSFADKKFMKTLSFTQYGFQLYDIKGLNNIVAKTPFKITKCATKREFIKNKLDQLVERKYYVIELTKP